MFPERIEHLFSRRLSRVFHRRPEIDPLLRAVMLHASFPCWCKWMVDDTDWPEMEFINPAYVDWYGEEMTKYPGRTDRDMWGDETGMRFRLMDFEAATNPGRLIEGVEPTPGGKTEWSLSRKIAIEYSYGIRVYGEAHEYR